MSNHMKESGVATGLRITFAIIMTITIGIFVNCIVLHNTVLNEKFWKKTILSDEIKDAVKEELQEQVKQYVINTSTPVGGTGEVSLQSIYDLETGDEFADEMIDFTMDEILDIFLSGDNEIDEDRFDEIFDEYGDDLFNELEESGVNVSREEFMQAKEEMFDELNGAIEEMHEETEENEVFEMIDLSSYKRSNLVTMIVTGIINVIMLVALIILHKNKFRPVRATGIAVTVTTVTSLIGWAILYGIFQGAGATVSKDAGELFPLIIKSLLKSIGKVIGIFGIASAIGVALIIIGCVGAGIVSNVYKKKHPQAAAPAVAYAPYTPYPAQTAYPATQTAYVPQQPAVQQPVMQQTVAAAQPVVQQVQPAPQPAAPVAPAAPAAWTCPNCGNTGITSNFCNNCGTKKP